jgi:hypothetical protein
MATKKNKTTVTAASTKTVVKANKPKYYAVVDSDMDLICQGTWDEVISALDEDWITGEYDDDDKQFINSLTVYELTNGKKLKYTPAKFEL